MKIRIIVNGKPLVATLQDNPTAADFVSLLPLSIELQDYASTEKISDRPRRLSTQYAAPGSAASAGDLTYYAPWGEPGHLLQESRPRQRPDQAGQHRRRRRAPGRTRLEVTIERLDR